MSNFAPTNATGTLFGVPESRSREEASEVSGGREAGWVGDAERDVQELRVIACS